MAKTVLIVEDNELNMKLFHDLLEAHGYQTVGTRNGIEALDLARKHHPDLILMDIQLPEVSGLEVTKWLKEDHELRAIPVVAVTAFAMKGDEERIREGGCEAYLSKPISVGKFIETIRHFLGQRLRRSSMTARVLVVDDVPANVKLLEARLSAEYFDVVTAMSGAEALAICERAECDIVLLDVMMPDMDGFEVCRRLKANPATHHIPVVMVTALDQPSDRVKGLEAGADDFLTKPVSDVALIARVRSLARLKMMTDELRMRAVTSRDIGIESPEREAVAETGRDGRILIVDDRPASGRAHRTACCRASIRSRSRPIRTRRCSTPPRATTTCSSSRSGSRISTGCGCAARCARSSARATCRSWRSPTPRTTRAWCAGSRSASTTT